MSSLQLHEQVIVAGDFNPPKARENTPDVRNNTFVRHEQWVFDQALRLADALANTHVTIKLNSALRFYGYRLISELYARELEVMVDLKFNDISNTLAADGALLAPYKPKFATVMCSTGLASMQTLTAALPDSKVLGVTVLTTHDENETDALYSRSVSTMVERLAMRGIQVPLAGYVCSPRELKLLRRKVPKNALLITPGVRPHWTSVKGDDQNPDRTMTPVEAINRGADAFVIGRPITRAKNPRDAVMRTLDEIHSAQ